MNTAVKSNICCLIFLLFGMQIMTSSCTRDDGDWDDIIELSQNQAVLNSSRDSILITTEGEWWWISNVSLDDDQINLDSTNTLLNTFEIKQDEFTIVKESLTELKIVMNDNDSEEDRLLKIGVQAGNYFDVITVLQEKK